MAVRRRKEVEDPNNTWNMQLMEAVIAKDTKTADELLLKGAQIDHYAAADISTFPAGVTDIRAVLAFPQVPGGSGAVIKAQSAAAASNAIAAFIPSAGAATSAMSTNPTTAPAPVNAALNSNVAAAAASAATAAGGGAGASLLPNGVDPNHRNSAFITPFIASLLNEDTETAAWVAAHGGNPNGQFNNGMSGTALHFFVRSDNAHVLDAVLSKRAAIDAHFDINAKESLTRLTAVELALFLRKPEMARILIRHGAANPFTTLVDGKYTSTQYACLTGDVATLETNLAAGDSIRQKDLNGQTLMHLALLQPAVMDVLIERGAGILFNGNNGKEAGGAEGAASGGSAAATGGSPNSRAATNAALSSTLSHSKAERNMMASTTGALAATYTAADPFATPLTLNTAFNDDGETPLIFVIKHWSACGPGTGIIPGAVAVEASGKSGAGAGASSSTVASSHIAGHTAGNAPSPSAQSAIASTAALLAGGGSTAGPLQFTNGLLSSQPRSLLPTIPIVAAATGGFNATIAAAIALAGGGAANAVSTSGGGAASVSPSTAIGADGATAAGEANKSEEAKAAGGSKKGDKNNSAPQSTFGYGLPRTALELVDLLVAKGADPSAVPDSTVLGLTPLMHAIVVYAPDIIRRLITDLKVDVNARDRSGAVALHYAVAARMKGVLDMLCAVEGIDLNACDRLGETPLHRAAIRGEAWAIQHLLQQTFLDVNAVDTKGFTAMHSAVEHNMKVSVEALLPRCNPDVGVPPPLEKGKKAPVLKKGQLPPEPPVPLRLNLEREAIADNATPLQLAVAQKKIDIALLLVAEGLARVQRPFLNNGFLLHEAVRLQSVPLVQLFLTRGADVHARDQKDQTALHAACDIPNADLTIVKLLLGANAIVDDQDNYNLNTPLHLAARREHVELVALLLASGAKPNIANKHLEMPIHVACDGAEPDTVNAVIDGSGARGTNVFTVKGMPGHRATLKAAGGGGDSDHHASDADYFYNRKAAAQPTMTLAELRNPTTAIPLAQRNFAARTTIIKTLIEAGSQLRSNDTEGRLPLHRAAASGNIDAIKLILEVNGRGNEASMLLSCDSKGWTPLHSAVALGDNVECVKLLLRVYEELPAYAFGVQPKAFPTVQISKPPAKKETPTVAFSKPQQWQAGRDSSVIRSSSSCDITADSATALTARLDATAVPRTETLTVDSDPVLAVLKRQDNSNRHCLLLAGTMGRVEIGRLLVKYQKERVEGLKAGRIVASNLCAAD